MFVLRMLGNDISGERVSWLANVSTRGYVAQVDGSEGVSLVSAYGVA